MHNFQKNRWNQILAYRLTLIGIIILTLLFQTYLSFADSINLKSGKIFKGRIIDSYNNEVQIKTKKNLYYVPFKQIIKIDGPEIVINQFNDYKKNNAAVYGTLPDPEKYDYYIKNINNINDFEQKNSQLPNNGDFHCGPAAASNALMWFDEIGFNNIFKNTNNEFQDQTELVKILQSERYMKTVSRKGTGTMLLIKGMKNFLKHKGYDDFIIGYQGLKNYSRKPPNINWIKGNSKKDAAMLLRLGFYKYDARTNIYKRTSGHWVTMVGYGINRYKQPDSNVLIIHNSWGSRFKNDYIFLKKINSGILTNNRWRKGRMNAKGFYIAEGFPTPRSKADVTIIEGVVAVVMPIEGRSREKI